MSTSETIKVWDPLLRVFHWSLALLFIVAVVTQEDVEWLHVYAGYGISLLVVFRLFWGLVGGRYARFSEFFYRPSTVKAYLKSLGTRSPTHYVGHNPAGGLMVLVMLTALLLQCFLGFSVLAIEGEGWFAGTWLASLNEDIVEELHEIIGNGLILLVAVHLAGVAVSSLLHRENLVRAMITGKKSAPKSAK